MEDSQRMVKVSVVWRGKKYVVELDSGASLKDLGDELQKLTDVKAETIRIIVPQLSEKGSNLLFPFSDEHSCLSLQEASIIEGKSIRMMGVSEDEVDRVLKDAKTDMRILGFEEEERRLTQRISNKSHASVKLPQGPYIFCGFRTLEIPGIELNPPPSEALKRMHMLAADPGIVAIMNKHHWRVGIMTEMAPVGYVGVSPKCILGFNKNHGEEISLRLRTDDLEGFRKYETIKKTLLHELAHMVYSEHDENFYALDKQLNQEAAILDWTKSKGQTLSGVRHTEDDTEENYFGDSENFSQKLGGSKTDQLESARASSVVAAYRRISNAITNNTSPSEVHEEPDPDDSAFEISDETKHRNSAREQETEPDPDDHCGPQKKIETEFDGSEHDGLLEPDSDDSGALLKSNEMMKNLVNLVQTNKSAEEPDPDDNLETEANILESENAKRSDDRVISESMEVQPQVYKSHEEPDPNDSLANGVVQAKPDPYDTSDSPGEIAGMNIDEPDPDDQEIGRIQASVTVVCSRIQKSIEILQTEMSPAEATTVLQTLFKIIRNVIEHPNEMKFKRLRKRNILNNKAAMEILSLIGFVEDITSDEMGKPETYLVLKRNDPGLLWLAKSSLEPCIAH